MSKKMSAKSHIISQEAETRIPHPFSTVVFGCGLYRRLMYTVTHAKAYLIFTAPGCDKSFTVRPSPINPWVLSLASEY